MRGFPSSVFGHSICGMKLKADSVDIGAFCRVGSLSSLLGTVYLELCNPDVQNLFPFRYLLSLIHKDDVKWNLEPSKHFSNNIDYLTHVILPGNWT